MRAGRWKTLVSSLDDPYPVYHELRSEGTVLRGAPGQWLVLGHAETSAALRDVRTSVDPTKAQRINIAPSPGAREARPRVGQLDSQAPRDRLFSLIRLDPPDHTRLRTHVSKAFTVRAIESVRPFVQQTVDELLDRAAVRGELDLVNDFGYELSVNVIGHLLGVPSHQRAMVAHWSEQLIRILNAPASPSAHVQAERQAIAQSRDYFTDLIAQRRADPRDDLLGRLIQMVEEEQITMRELLSLVLLLIAAGHETVVKLISSGALALANSPDQFELLRNDPSLIEDAVEEFLRFEPPVQIVIRFMTDDVELGGKRITKGSQLAIIIGAANRDPSVFADPDRLDIRRQDNRHLSFAAGIHFCLGASLARLEAQVALGSLVGRYPRLDVLTDRVERLQNLVLRGLTSLPVRL
ncbi:MAG: cytochrome P450 [Actinomycetota bacterium]